MQDREIRLNVADMVVSLMIEPGVRIAGFAGSFLAEGPAEATVNIRSSREIRRAGEWHQLATGEDFGWSAFETADGKFVQVERHSKDVRVRFASKAECQVVDVLLGVPEDGPEDGGWPECEYLLLETLPLPVVVLLSGRAGLSLHSCAVAYEGNGILFSGVSGSGKSTMANLWRRFGPSTSCVIDDEHIIARRLAESIYLYGAPWSRGQQEATFSRTAATAIFFLSHGTRNRCTRLSPSEAFSQFLSQVYLPVWSRDQVELTLQTCAGLLQQVDCYHLQFVPDSEVIGLVQHVLGGSG